MKLDKVKILADELYNQKVLDGWKNVSIEECLKRATDYYRIDEIVKNNDLLHSVSECDHSNYSQGHSPFVACVCNDCGQEI